MAIHTAFYHGAQIFYVVIGKAVFQFFIPAGNIYAVILGGCYSSECFFLPVYTFPVSIILVYLPERAVSILETPYATFAI